MKTDYDICKRCNGLGVVYVSMTKDGLYWNTCDCPECRGTGDNQKDNQKKIL